MSTLTKNLTDEELDELEAQFQDLDEKTILIQILWELKAIRMAQGESENSNSKPSAYRCEACGEMIHEDKLKSHAENEHNAPQMPIEDLGLFDLTK